MQLLTYECFFVVTRVLLVCSGWLLRYSHAAMMLLGIWVVARVLLMYSRFYLDIMMFYKDVNIYVVTKILLCCYAVA